ncbi:hypothetical protein HBI26_035660 [Parastagonospora nodorum]|nr:hypothetical protein HBI26_035660 [Parastagonospora nodorum]
MHYTSYSGHHHSIVSQIHKTSYLLNPKEIVPGRLPSMPATTSSLPLSLLQSVSAPASRAASLFLLPPPIHQWLSLNMLSLKDSKEAESTPPTPTPR